MFENEMALEKFIRSEIACHITQRYPDIYCLNNKKAVDILVCKDSPTPALFFIEVKYHKANHGRLGFGSSNGGGFQPEILTKLPAYFKQNLRWVLASEIHYPDRVIMLDCEQISQFVAGGSIGQKFNNFQPKIWKEANWLSHDEFRGKLTAWMTQ